MAESTIKITPTLESLIKRLGGDMRGGFEAGMKRVLLVAEAHAIDIVPVVSTDLLQSITSFVADSGRTGVLKATALYALFVHEGTKPHVIRPKSPGGSLKFTIGGVTIFRKKVNHPGTKANPFLQKGVDKTDLGKEFEAGIQGFLDKRGW